jgi:predicted PurR-regulated permease PerM
MTAMHGAENPQEQRRSETEAEGEHKLRQFLLWAGLVTLVALLPFMSGLIGALMLFVITRRPHAALSRLVPARVSAAIIAVATGVVLLIPGAWLLSNVVSAAADGLRALQSSEVLDRLTNVRIGPLDLGRDFVGVSSTVLTWLSSRAFAFFGSITLTTLNLVIALFGLFYLLIDGARLWRRLTRLVPVSERVAGALGARFVSVTEALLLGTVLTAALQGSLVGGGFAIVGLQPAVLWGLITAVVSVLPIMGSALVWLPGIVVLVAQHRIGAAIFIAIVGGGLASNLDNLVRILLFRRISGIHPMITLVGAFAGVRIFGMVGVLIGPLLLSYFFELARIDEVRASALTPAAVSAGDTGAVRTTGGPRHGGNGHEA